MKPSTPKRCLQSVWLKEAMAKPIAATTDTPTISATANAMRSNALDCEVDCAGAAEVNATANEPNITSIRKLLSSAAKNEWNPWRQWGNELTLTVDSGSTEETRNGLSSVDPLKLQSPPLSSYRSVDLRLLLNLSQLFRSATVHINHEPGKIDKSLPITTQTSQTRRHR